MQGLNKERRLNLKLNDLINEHYGLSMLPEKPVFYWALKCYGRRFHGA